MSKTLGNSAGQLDKKFRDWCLSNPSKLYGDVVFENVAKVRELQVNCIRDFDETASDIFDDILGEEDFNVKNNDASAMIRDKGNQLYQKKQFKAAIELYNKAISHAKDDSVLALGYANRSAVLFQMEEFKACYRDIERAIKSSYPQNLHKLLDRKGKCLMKLSHFSDAIITFGEAIAMAKKNISDETKLRPFINEAQKGLKLCSSKKSASVQLVNYFDSEESNLPMLTGMNPKMPAFSKAVKITYSKENGRHGVATRKIGCGEVILIENSGFNFANFKSRAEVCTHCLCPKLDLIPSPLSANDMFCCTTCKENAMNSYHDKEARLLSILENSGLGQEEWLISLRLVLSKSLSFFLKNRKELLANCERRDYAANDSIDDETFMSSDYSSVFNLQTNEVEWSAQNLHMCAFVAYFFLHCLRKVEYFGTTENQTKKELNEDEIFIVEILMQLMNVSSTNTSETGIFNVGGVSGSLMEGEIKPIGGSIQPAIALLNHSCDPNTIRTIQNGSFILLASRDIQEDEEVFNNYYVNFAEKDTEDRRNYLSRKYCFQCDCQACLENWPTKEQMPKNLDDLRPGQLLIDLGNQMALMQQVQKIQKLGSCISQEQKAGNYQKAFGFCIQFIRVLENTIERPHAYYLMAEKSLFKLAWILHGSMSH